MVPAQLKAEPPTYGAKRHKPHILSCHQIQHYAINKRSAVFVWVSILQQCDRSTDGIFNALVAVKFMAPLLWGLCSVGCKFLTDVSRQPTHFMFSVQALQEMFRSFR